MLLPSIRPDELSKGYLGRIAALNCYKNLPTLLASLASLSKLPPNTPSANSMIAAQTGMTLGSFLAKHTVLPFHRAVCTMENWRPFADGTDQQAIATFKRPSGTSDAPLFLCHKCASDDLKVTGLSIWRRSHQLPGVVTCARHNVGLSMAITSSLPQFPHKCIATAKPLATDVVQDALARPVIIRYMKFCEMLANRTKPYTTRQITQTIGSRLQEIDPSAKGKPVRLTSLILELQDSPWFQLYFPRLLRERGANNLNSFDKASRRIDLAYATTHYALALAVLFETIEDALQALGRNQAESNDLSHLCKGKNATATLQRQLSCIQDRDLAEAVFAFANGASIEKAVLTQKVTGNEVLNCLREIIKSLVALTGKP